MTTNGTPIHLVVDNGTHSGTITRLRTISDSALFVTAGNDKRLRTWSIGAEPTLVRTMIGDIGPGRDGEPEALTVQPWTTLVWASVRRAPNVPGTRRSELQLFDMIEGELLHAVDSTQPINDLAFTPDGRHLIVACPRTLQILDVTETGSGPDSAPTLVAEIDLGTDPFRLATADLGATTRIFVSSLWQPHPRIVDFSDDGPGATLTEVPFDAAPRERGYRPDQVAASDRHLAVACHDGGPVEIHDINGRPVTSIDDAGGGRASELAFSSDGRLLIVGSRSGAESVVTVHDADDGFALVSRRRFDDDVHAIGLIDDPALGGAPTAVAAGGSRFSIVTWPSRSLAARPGEQNASGVSSEDVVVDGSGEVITTVRIIEATVAVGSARSNGEINTRLDLDSLTAGVVESVLIEKSHGPLHDDGSRSLSMSAGHNLMLDPGSVPLTGHAAFPWDYAESYCLVGDDHVATGGRSGVVRMLRWDAAERRLHGRKLVGHVGPVLAMAADDRWLVTGGRDQVVRLWFLPAATTESSTPDDDLDALEPALNLFIAGREWVVWTASGFYASSAAGERFISFHANRGFGRRAWAFPADRFVDLLYRPDVITAVFETGSEAAALAQLGIETPVMADHLPPVIEATNVVELEPFLFRLEFTVFDLAEPATRVWVLQDGLLEWELDLSDDPAPIGGARMLGYELWLEPGRNDLRILAESGGAKSIAVDLAVEVDDAGHHLVDVPSELYSEGFESEPVGPTSSVGSTPTAIPVAVSAPPPISSAPSDPEGSPGVTVSAVDLAIDIRCEPSHDKRRLRAEVNGVPLWTAVVDHGASVGLRAVMPVPDGDGVAMIVDESGGVDRMVFSADARAAHLHHRTEPYRADPMPIDPPLMASGPELSPGFSVVGLTAKSEDDGDGEPAGSSDGRPDAQRAGRPTRVSPELFLLTVGVSKLRTKGQSVGDLNYAADDAKTLADRFEAGSDELFSKVHSWTVTDAAATKAGIETARDELVAAVFARSRRKGDERLKARDVIVAFFSGHGVTRPGQDGEQEDFYLVTHDFLSNDAAGTGVLFADIVQPFFAIRDFELVVLVDTCRSGHAGIDFIERVDPEKLARRLTAPSEQAQHFLCSTSGDQLSYEYKLPYLRTTTPVGHGLFTHAIIRQMDGEATVSISGLADGIGRSLDTWTWNWPSRQEPTQYLYGGGRYLRLYKRR